MPDWDAIYTVATGAVPEGIKGPLMGMAYSNYLIMLERDRRRERTAVPDNIFHTQRIDLVAHCFHASAK